MTKTKIEWADTTLNCFAGCTRVSEGCENCYAIPLANRLAHHPNQDVRRRYQGLVERRNGRLDWTGRVNLDHHRLSQLEKLKPSQRIFHGSMGDLFHPRVPFDFVAFFLATLEIQDQHTHIILTKRSKRMRAYFEWMVRRLGNYRIGPHIWLMVSIENQARLDERVPDLLEVKDLVGARVAGVSLEPLLGPIDVNPYLPKIVNLGQDRAVEIGGLDWVILGFESGPRARPGRPDWARSVRDDCVAANAPFFFKQWGEWSWDNPDYNSPWKAGKKLAGRELDDRTWDEIPPPC